MDDIIEDVILKRLEEYGDSVVGEPVKKKTKRDHEQSLAKIVKTIQKQKPQPIDKTKDIQFMSKSKRKRLKKKMKKLSSENNSLSLASTKSAETVKPSNKNNQDVYTLDADSDWGEEFDDSDGELDGAAEDNQKTPSEKVRTNKQVELLRKELGLEEFKHQVEIESVAVQEEQKKNGKQPEVVVFKTHRQKERVKPDQGKDKGSKQVSQDEVVEFNMNKARYEVQKYGIKGFHGDQKEEAMTAMLIKLGAKPPKNKYKNYVEYQEERKQALQRDRENKEKERNSGLKLKKSGDHGRKRVRDKNDIGELDGQVGRWKKGVQVVKKADLKGFRASKIKT